MMNIGSDSTSNQPISSSSSSSYLSNHHYSSYLTDGLHLNQRGNEFVAKKLDELIHTSYPSFSSFNLPIHQKEWRDFLPPDDPLNNNPQNDDQGGREETKT